jgi:DNA invertase Pin-like site-specific DNA recombinase
LSIDASKKVRASHLQRDAYLYIRQSTLKQVQENVESTKRQYALRQKAVALGWPQDGVIVIDSDLGQSGAQSSDREGFQRLVSEVSLGKAGLVMGLEVSRLARNSADWHRLLELCAFTDTLIADEDGVYDPASFNDRLLLGLKGTMSEAELHYLKSRMQGGLMNKAKRGALRIPLPVGLIYDCNGETVLDPNQQVQDSVKLVFELFNQTGSAHATCKEYEKRGLKFPLLLRRGSHKGEMVWKTLLYSRVVAILDNPRYAGVYCFGRSRARKNPDGKCIIRQNPPEEWIFIPDAHPGYISLDEYKSNKRRLKENSSSFGNDRRYNTPREGPALLQGRVICGVCGTRMQVRYNGKRENLSPVYRCCTQRKRTSAPTCQTVSGTRIDAAIEQLLFEVVTPMSLELAISVQEEMQARWHEVDALRSKEVERVRYEAELARRRFMQVEPENRLVANSLEAEWNKKLLALNAAVEQYEQQKKSDLLKLTEEQKLQVMALVHDFRKLWSDPGVTFKERKRIVSFMIEDVTLTKGKFISVQVRFKGGAERSLQFPKSPPLWERQRTPANVVSEIASLAKGSTDRQIAKQLNSQGRKSGTGKAFDRCIIQHIRFRYGIKSLFENLREQGLLTKEEISEVLGVTPQTILAWRKKGSLKGRVVNHRNEYLFEPPSCPLPNRGVDSTLPKSCNRSLRSRHRGAV